MNLFKNVRIPSINRFKKVIVQILNRKNDVSSVLRNKEIGTASMQLRNHLQKSKIFSDRIMEFPRLKVFCIFHSR